MSADRRPGDLRGLFTALVTALFLAFASPSAGQFASARAVAFPRSHLQITATDGSVHEFTVEVARTPAQRGRGLMFRTHLDPDAGMLFLYPSPQRARMWMKDTPLSLDMLFLGPGGEVLEIAERTDPLSLATISSTDPARGVLELPGGRCTELGITPGSRVQHPAFPHRAP